MNTDDDIFDEIEASLARPLTPALDDIEIEGPVANGSTLSMASRKRARIDSEPVTDTEDSVTPPLAAPSALPNRNIADLARRIATEKQLSPQQLNELIEFGQVSPSYNHISTYEYHL